MRRSTPPLRLAIAVLLLCAPACGALAHAATRSFPGVAPCNGTLQGCIASASPGDRIELVSAGPFDESLAIGKSLTLVAAAGVVPVIGGGPTARTVTVSDDGVAAGSSIVLQGLVLQHARIAATLGFVNDTTLTVADCTIAHETAALGAIDVEAYAPATVSLLRNAITSPGFGIRAIPSLTPGQVLTLAIHGNRLATADPAGSYGGIGLVLYGGGTIAAGITSNAIRGVGGCQCGGAGGIAVTIQGAAVNAIVDLVNNTIADLDAPGIIVGAPPAGSGVSVQLYNNVVVGAVGVAASLPAASGAVTLAGGANDWFDPSTVALGGMAASPADLALDPLFVDRANGDVRLQAASPLVDSGSSTPAAALTPYDAANASRVAGASVDGGAYERDGIPLATTTTTTVTTSTATLASSTSTTTVTLPGCAPAISFASLRCRLDALDTAVRALAPADPLQQRLLRPLAGAATQLDTAETRSNRARRRAVHRATARLQRFVRLLHSRAARPLDAGARTRLIADARNLQNDLRELPRN